MEGGLVDSDLLGQFGRAASETAPYRAALHAIDLMPGQSQQARHGGHAGHLLEPVDDQRLE